MSLRFFAPLGVTFLLLASCSHSGASRVGDSAAGQRAVRYSDDSAEGQCLARANAQRTPPADAPDSISVSHVLVRHMELKRPEGATRSRGQACLRALRALEVLQGGAEWNAVAREYSDSGQDSGGELGTIDRDMVGPAFANAAFSLESNELSYVVETDRGFHVILRH